MKPQAWAAAGEAQDAPRYRRPNRLRRAGALALGAGGIISVACGGGDKPADQGITASQWIETDGAAGRINLDDVQQAYRESLSSDGFQVTKFEEAVNKIYEGDNVVLIQVERKGDTIEVSGWEDLDANKTLDTNTDDKLFTITQELKNDGQYTTQGYGANGYYHASSPFGGFLPVFFGSLVGNVAGQALGNALFGPRYVTPPASYDSLSSSRSVYRSSTAYQGQQQRNASYGGSVAGRFPSSTSAQPVSPARSSYQTRQVNSGAFRSSGSTTRSLAPSSSGGSSKSGSGGGSGSSSGSSKSSGSSGKSGGKSGGSSSGSGGGVTGGGGVMRL